MTLVVIYEALATLLGYRMKEYTKKEIVYHQGDFRKYGPTAEQVFI